MSTSQQRVKRSVLAIIWHPKQILSAAPYKKMHKMEMI